MIYYGSGPSGGDAEDDRAQEDERLPFADRPPGPEDEPLFLLLNLDGLNMLLESLKEDSCGPDAEVPTLVVVPITTDTNEVLHAARKLRGNPPFTAGEPAAEQRDPQYCMVGGLSSPPAHAGGDDRPEPPPGTGGYSEDMLSTRQTEVLECLIQGYSNKQIARRLGLEEGTVRGHVRTVLQKMGAKNRTQAACFAIKRRYAARSHGEMPAARPHQRRNPCGSEPAGDEGYDGSIGFGRRGRTC